MANIQKFEQSLDQMIQLMVQMKQALKEDESSVQQSAPVQQQSVPIQSVPPSHQAIVENTLGSFEQLKQALQSEKWPEAVNPNLICDPTSEPDKIERSRGIIELMIEDDLKGLKVLDIGCGEGHLSDLATEYQAALSVGYDIKAQDRWNTFEPKQNRVFTTDFEAVKSHGPFDIVLLFDVIDHVQGESPANLIFKAHQVLAPEGKVYMRCHPFMARHATHLYHAINKAYVHLVFTPEELTQLGVDQTYAEPSIEVLYPLKTYADFIQKAGLKAVNRREITEQAENFFKIPKIAERIMNRVNFKDFPEFQMGLQFVDYVLKKT